MLSEDDEEGEYTWWGNKKEGCTLDVYIQDILNRLKIKILDSPVEFKCNGSKKVEIIYDSQIKIDIVKNEKSENIYNNAFNLLFREGTLKAGVAYNNTSKPKPKCLLEPEEILNMLTDYFEMEFSELFKNSNLPKEYKNAIKGILE